MGMRDLLQESAAMQQKILEYHNQAFVLNSIGDSQPFTPEGHRRFLESLPHLERKHYIVYFDHEPIGKFSFNPPGKNADFADELGDYLFFEDDLRSGLGVLLRMFSERYLFECLGIREVRFSVRKDNKASNATSRKMGARQVSEAGGLNFYTVSKDDYIKARGKYDPILQAAFAGYTRPLPVTSA